LLHRKASITVQGRDMTSFFAQRSGAAPNVSARALCGFPQFSLREAVIANLRRKVFEKRRITKFLKSMINA